MFDFEKLGQGIRYFRLHEGLSQEKLAEMIDVVPRHLSRIENGSAQPGIKTVVNICNALNVGINDLLESDHETGNILYRQFRSQIATISGIEKHFIGDLINNVFDLKD